MLRVEGLFGVVDLHWFKPGFRIRSNKFVTSLLPHHRPSAGLSTSVGRLASTVLSRSSRLAGKQTKVLKGGGKCIHVFIQTLTKWSSRRSVFKARTGMNADMKAFSRDRCYDHIFCDFRKFSAKNGVFSKANVMLQSARQAGVDVMITMFCYICQFSAKKIAFFSKTNVMLIFL
jgi:hypothetical protein